MSHAALTNNLQSVSQPSSNASIIAQGDHQEVVMGILPFFHIYGAVAIMLISMFNGAHVVTLPKFDPKLFVSSLSKNKVN